MVRGKLHQVVDRPRADGDRHRLVGGHPLIEVVHEVVLRVQAGVGENERRLRPHARGREHVLHGAAGGVEGCGVGDDGRLAAGEVRGEQFRHPRQRPAPYLHRPRLPSRRQCHVEAGTPSRFQRVRHHRPP
jgi:hypothetical protein